MRASFRSCARTCAATRLPSSPRSARCSSRSPPIASRTSSAPPSARPPRSTRWPGGPQPPTFLPWPSPRRGGHAAQRRHPPRAVQGILAPRSACFKTSRASPSSRLVGRHRLTRQSRSPVGLVTLSRPRGALRVQSERRTARPSASSCAARPAPGAPTISGRSGPETQTWLRRQTRASPPMPPSGSARAEVHQRLGQALQHRPSWAAMTIETSCGSTIAMGPCLRSA